MGKCEGFRGQKHAPAQPLYSSLSFSQYIKCHGIGQAAEEGSGGQGQPGWQTDAESRQDKETDSELV